MSRPFVLAHVSDLHVSTFGDTFHDRLRVVSRSARVADTERVRWETMWEEAGWRVLHRRGAGAAKIVLVDPEGYRHPVPSRREMADGDPVERAAMKACRLEARRARTLAATPPGPVGLAVLSQLSPKNTNVRLLRAVLALDESVDAVIITGDLTDNGAGYELVEAAFARWKERGLLFAVPGNHDIYMFPFAGSGRPRASPESKRSAWRDFAGKLDLQLDASGAWHRALPDASAVLVGLDSCSRPQRRFFRHNGAIGPGQIAFLRELARTSGWARARHRIVALHHHVVPLPHGVGRRAPSEIGMRLDDAATAAQVFDELGVTCVIHGHRHVSEERCPAGARFRILAAPSLTLGCRSGDAASYWRIELGERLHAERVHLAVPAVAGDSVVDLTDASGEDEAGEAEEALEEP